MTDLCTRRLLEEKRELEAKNPHVLYGMNRGSWSN